MDTPDAEYERRVLVFAPIGRDGALTQDLLRRAGIDGFVCSSVDHLIGEFERGAGVVILTEEPLDDRSFAHLPVALARQAAWSDVPVILFAGNAQSSAALRTLGLAEALRNVTFIDRPIRLAAIISVVRAALRARMRQYELRDTLVALDAARTEAEAASRLKDEFLATLSHELRTPLNAILGWTAMLRHGQVDEVRIGRALEVVERNARAQARLIEDVLDMARIITGKLHLEMRPALLGPVVDAAIDAIRPAAETKSIRLRLAAGPVPAIYGDPARLQQILWNLLSNAVKFTPSGGEVTVSLQLVDSYAMLAVSDTGPGLAPEFLPYVFDRFRQADQSVTRGHGGLGLGLSIVKHLVELHGGTVRAESGGVGQGATFRVALPIPAMLEAPTDRRDRDHSKDAFAVRLDGRHVLVVDDDESTRELLAGVDRAGGRARDDRGLNRERPRDDPTPPARCHHRRHRHARRRRPRFGPAHPRAATPAGRGPGDRPVCVHRAEDQESAIKAGFTSFIAKPATPQQLLRALDELMNASDR